MAKHTQQNQNARPVRHGVVMLVLLFLPLFAIAGALAPGIVTIQYQDEEEEVAGPAPERTAYRPVRLSRKPLLVPRDFSPGFIPEVLDLEQLFMGTQYRVEAGSRLTRLPTFPRGRGDMIVLDDVDIFISETLFKDVLQPGVVADATAVWDPKLFDIIPMLTGPDGGSQFDDFTGQGELTVGLPPVIPEPATASLLALGLMGLGAAARRRQRQPATS